MQLYITRLPPMVIIFIGFWMEAERYIWTGEKLGIFQMLINVSPTPPEIWIYVYTIFFGQKMILE